MMAARRMRSAMLRFAHLDEVGGMSKGSLGLTHLSCVKRSSITRVLLTSYTIVIIDLPWGTPSKRYECYT